MNMKSKFCIKLRETLEGKTGSVSSQAWNRQFIFPYHFTVSHHSESFFVKTKKNISLAIERFFCPNTKYHFPQNEFEVMIFLQDIWVMGQVMCHLVPFIGRPVQLLLINM